MPDVIPEATGTSSTSTAAPATQGGGTEASLNAAIDAAMGEIVAEASQVAPEAAAPAQAAAAVDPEPELRGDDLRALSRAQARLTRERQAMKEQVNAGKEDAKRAVLKALESDDPDHALGELGFTADQRRILAQRLVLRQVPADQAPESLKHQVELASLQSRYDRRIEALEKRIDADAQARTAAIQADQQAAAEKQALTAMDEAFSAADGPLGTRYKHARQREMVKRDAFDVGREMLASGEISARMTDRDIAKKIATRLNADYAEAFGVAAAPATATPTPGARQTQALRPGEVTPGRTISRSMGAPARPAPNGPPTSEREVLDALADEFRASRRAGDVG